MVRISIICLIYKSTKLADLVYESLYKYTPMLHTGEAELIFVANDASDEVIAHLIEKKYNFVINENKVLSKEELFSKGYAAPEYINRVYRGYNQGILHSKGEQLVLINSDNFFSPDWLENLLKYSSFDNIISSQLVEPGNIVSDSFFDCALRANFGKTTETFEEAKFIDYSLRNRKTGLRKGGAFMPCVVYKSTIMLAGLYPEGNIAGENFETVKRYGDVDLYERYMKLGIEHYTSLDSISYHLAEGEKNEETTINSNVKIDENIKKHYKLQPYNNKINNNIIYNSLVYSKNNPLNNLLLDNLKSDDNSYLHFYFHKYIENYKHKENITLKSLKEDINNIENNINNNIKNDINNIQSSINYQSKCLNNLINVLARRIPIRKIRDRFREKIYKQ